MSVRNKLVVNTHYTRSINLERDANSLDVVNAYIPTSRALKLFARVSEAFNTNQSPRAWSLIGPYGSGKSSSSVFLSHLLSGPELETTKAAYKILKNSADDIAKTYRKEIANSSGFLKVMITGAPEPMGKKIVQGLHDAAEQYFGAFRGPSPRIVADLKELSDRESISTSEVIELVKVLQDYLGNKDCCGIYLVVDELGKFLEYEARHYGANDIYLLQALAEHACRGSDCNLFLFVLLHQSFEQYAKGLGEGLKNEWSKVQGRFEDVPFLESAEQVLRVVSAAFTNSFSPSEKNQLKSTINDIVDVLYSGEALPGVLKQGAAVELMMNCYPLHPVSAILLPMLCQKVAQNERTLFSYLGSHEEFGLQDMLDKLDSVEDMIYPHHVYNYFITNQPAALGDYRTHRRWAEVVTAIERLGDAPEEHIDLLKTIGLLNIIGIKGGFKASRAILETCSKNRSVATRNLKALTDKSIITFRRFSGEYRVWQGSDFDLEDALQEEKNNLGEFSLASELNKPDTLMPVVARRYTINSGTLRYFLPEFVDAQTYRSCPVSFTEPRIIFFLASAKDDEKLFRDQIATYFSEVDIVSLCLNGSQLRDATAEVLALRQVQNTRQELNSDPVAKREFEDRLAAAEHSQNALLQGLLEQPQDCLWFNNGLRLKVKNKRNFQEELSSVLERVYCKAPILHNELINRDRPSAQANAARNKLLEAMLLHPNEVDLGIDKYPPEKAIYRSILRETGLHDRTTHEFREPSKRSTLYHVWKEINNFLDSTEKAPKSFAELNNTLMAPPYGVKAGVLPILYITTYIVFQHELAIYEDSIYKPVLTIEMIDRFVKRPDEFTFQRFRITGLRSSIYKEYCKIIDTGSKQTVIQLVNPLAQFISELPLYTLKTKSADISEKAKAVRNAFQFSRSPEYLIFEDIPKALGYEKELGKKNPNMEGLSISLRDCLKELKDAYPNMLQQQIKMLAEAFHMDASTSLEGLRRKAAGRYDGLDQHTVDVDGLRAFIKRVTKKGGSDEEWLENILMFLGQKPSKTWTDADRSEADVKLSDFGKRILDLEALRLHYDRSKKHMEGDFDVYLLKSLKKGGEPIDEVVAVDKKRKEAIQGCKDEVFKALEEHSSELQLATLAEVVDEFLSTLRQSRNTAQTKPRGRLKGVNNG